MTEGPTDLPPIPAIERIKKRFICLSCGYSLYAICTKDQPTGQCPECGEPFDRDEIRRVLAKAPRNMTLSDHLFMKPVFFGFILGVLFWLLAFLVTGIDWIPDILGVLLLPTALVCNLVFSVWYGHKITRIDLLNNWRRHALGETHTLRQFQVLRWALFSLLNFITASIIFVSFGCCAVNVIA